MGARTIGLIMSAMGMACSESTSPVIAGAVRVIVSTTGGTPGAERGRVVLDGRFAEPVTGTNEALFTPVSAGQHLVALDQLASGCQVTSDLSQTVSVAPNDTTDVGFDVECSPALGGLLVRVTMSGVDQDPNGSTILIDGQPMASGVFGQTSVTLPPGSHTVTLADLTRSCQITGDQTQTPLVSPGGSVTVDFAVACSLSPPAGRGQEIVFETNRAGLNAVEREITQLYSVNTDGTGLHLLSEVPRGEQTAAAWSPDGARLLFSLQSESFDNLLFIMNSDGSDVAPFLAIRAQAAWSPDMSQVAFGGTTPDGLEGIMLVKADAPSLDNLGVIATADLVSRPTWSPDGRHLAFTSDLIDPEFGGVTSLLILDLGTLQSTPVPIPFDFLDSPAWSPDGQWIAFEGSPDFSVENTDIYVVRPDGSDLTRLTHTRAAEHFPAWSPDGRHIAFSSDRDGNAEIYVMNADGTEPVRLTNDPGEDTRPAWRP